MNKVYNRINWENKDVSTNTPLNSTNLNKMDLALNVVDDRVVSFDTSKANQSDLLTALSNWDINNDTGVVTLTFKNGTTQTINTNISKIATNISYDAVNERLVITLPDGSKEYVDMSALITQYEFLNSSTVGFSVDASGKVTASVVDGSITEAKLQPNYLADIKLEVGKAEQSAENSYSSELNAKTSEENAKQSEDNAKALVDNAMNLLSSIEFMLSDDGNLYYKTDNSNIVFRVDETTGQLQFKILKETV